jgi:hypothetical protein
MEIELPELAEVDAVLEPDDRVVRGADRPEPVRGAVSLGMPVVQAVTADLAGADAALRAFLADEATDWSFHLVYLGATFTPADGARFGKAWLTVRMSRDDGAAPPPIAWSLTPQRTERPVERPTSVKIGAKLIFDTSLEVAAAGRRNEVFIDSYGLQEPACTWEFSRTSVDELRGTQRLALVARVPKDIPVTGVVDLRATLLHRRLGLLSYRVPLADHATPAFRLA